MMEKQMDIVSYVIKMDSYIWEALKKGSNKDQDLKQVEEEKKLYNIKMEFV